MKSPWSIFWLAVAVIALLFVSTKVFFRSETQALTQEAKLRYRIMTKGEDPVVEEHFSSRTQNKDAGIELESAKLRKQQHEMEQVSTETMVRITPYVDRYITGDTMFYEAEVGSRELTGKEWLLPTGYPVRVLFPEQCLEKEGFSENLVRINLLQSDGTEKPGYVRISRVSTQSITEQLAVERGCWWEVPDAPGESTILHKAVTLAPGQESDWLAFRVPGDIIYQIRVKKNVPLRAKFNSGGWIDAYGGQVKNAPELVGSARVKVQLSPLAQGQHNIRFVVKKDTKGATT